MKTTAGDYTYSVRRANLDEGFFFARCVELSIWATAETPEKALKAVREEAETRIESLRADKKRIPPPLHQRKCSGKILLRLPEELHQRLMIEAEERDVSMNAYVLALLQDRHR